MEQDQKSGKFGLNEAIIEAVTTVLGKLPNIKLDINPDALVKSLEERGYSIVTKEVHDLLLDQERKNLAEKLFEAELEQAEQEQIKMLKEHILRFEHRAGKAPIATAPNELPVGAYLVFKGELDALASRGLDNSLDDAKKENDSVVIDFSKVTYISSASIGVLLTHAEKFKKLSVINVRPKQYEVFEILGIKSIGNMTVTKMGA